MKKCVFALFAVIMLLNAGMAGAQEFVEFSPKIKKAMVFTSNEARLTRSGEISLKKGKNVLKTGAYVLDGCADPGNVQVHIHGARGVELENIEVRSEAVDEESYKEKFAAFELEKEAGELALFEIGQKIKLNSQKVEVARNVLRMVDTFRQKMAEKTSNDAKRLEMSVEVWMQGMDAAESRSLKAREAIVALESEMRELQKKQQKAQGKVWEIQRKSPGRKISPRLYLTFDAKEDCTATVSLVHGVRGANWSPVYRAVADIEQKTLKIAMFANVTQKTREDWKGVELAFSTARPELGSDIPRLTAWYLRGAPRLPKPRPEQAVFEVKRGRMSPVMPAPRALMPARESEPGVEDEPAEAGAVTVFTAESKADIISDGRTCRVRIAEFDSNFELEHIAVPKVLPHAFMLATAVNKADFPLLGGAVDVNVGDSYVGKGFIKATAPGERLKLGLGVDQSIRVSTRLVDDKVTRRRRGTTVTTTNAFETKVANFGKNEASVTLYDQIPISRLPDVKVSYGSDVKRALRGAEFPGQLSWTFSLSPGKEKKVDFEFAIEYPEAQRQALETSNRARFQQSMNWIDQKRLVNKVKMRQMVPQAKF